MKEELGLDHFEGRSWSGLHHHAVPTMVAYGFLAAPAAQASRREPAPLRRRDAGGAGKNRRRKARPTPALRPCA